MGGGGGGGGILEDRGGGDTLREGVSCAAQMEPHRETMQPISSPTSLPNAASVGRSSTAQYINWFKLREGGGGAQTLLRAESVGQLSQRAHGILDHTVCV